MVAVCLPDAGLVLRKDINAHLWITRALAAVLSDRGDAHHIYFTLGDSLKQHVLTLLTKCISPQCVDIAVVVPGLCLKMTVDVQPLAAMSSARASGRRYCTRDR